MSLLLGLGLKSRKPYGAAALLSGAESDGVQLLTGTDNQFTGWTDVNEVTTRAGTTTAPDGTANGAARMTDVASVQRHIIYYLQGGFVAGNDYTFSIYAKYSNMQYLNISIGDSGGAGKIYAIFNLINGTVTDSGISVAGAGANIIFTSIAAAVNGFYKLSLRGRANNGSTSLYVQVCMTDQATLGPVFAGDPQYAGTGSGNVFVWRPKVAA